MKRLTIVFASLFILIFTCETAAQLGQFAKPELVVQTGIKNIDYIDCDINENYLGIINDTIIILWDLISFKLIKETSIKKLDKNITFPILKKPRAYMDEVFLFDQYFDISAFKYYREGNGDNARCSVRLEMLIDRFVLLKNDSNIISLYFILDSTYKKVPSWLMLSENQNASWSKQTGTDHQGIENFFMYNNGAHVLNHNGTLMASRVWTKSGQDLIIWDIETLKEIEKIDLNNKLIEKITFSPDDNYIAFQCFDGFTIDSNYSSSTLSYSLYLYNLKNNEKIMIDSGRGYDSYTGGFPKIVFSGHSKYLYYTNVYNQINIYDLKKHSSVKSIYNFFPLINALNFSNDSKFLGTSSYYWLTDQISYSNIYLWRLFELPLLKAATKTEGVNLSLFLSNQGSYILCKNSIYSLSIGGFSSNDYSFSLDLSTRAKLFEAEYGCFDITDDNEYITYLNNDGDIEIKNTSRNNVDKLIKTELRVHSLSISPNKKFLAAGGYNDGDSIFIWDLNNNNSVPIVKLNGYSSGIGRISELRHIYRFDTLKILNIPIYKSHFWGGGNEIIFSDDSKKLFYLSLEDSIDCYFRKINVYNTENWQKIELENCRFRQLDNASLSLEFKRFDDGVYLLERDLNTSNSMRVYDPLTGCIVYSYNDLSWFPSFSISSDSKLLAFAGTDNEIKIINLHTKDTLSILPVFPYEAYLVYTPDNYYTCSPGGYKAVAFRVGNRAYPFEQFDLQYNRPDIILERLGYATKEYIDTCRWAYQLRMNIMKVDTTRFTAEFALPELEVLNEDEIYSFEGSTLKLKINAKAKRPEVPLDRFNVYVNEVPYFGLKGTSLNNAIDTTFEVSVPLSSGKNRIQVSAFDVASVESLRKFYEKQVPEKKSLPNLYILTAGIEKYNDTSLNPLNFTIDDCDTVMSIFKSQKGSLYDKVITFRLTDADATSQNIKSIKNEFMKSRVDDYIVVFLSGHGITKEHQFHYCTYGYGLTDNDKEGLSFEDIIDLIDSIPARNKLVMIDACQSGEAYNLDSLLKIMDVTDSVQIAEFMKCFQLKEDQNGNKLAYRGSSFKIDKNLTDKEYQQKFPERDSIDRTVCEKLTQNINPFGVINKYQELFVDMNGSSGAIVLTSSSAFESSAEDPEINQGVFTQFFKKGFEAFLIDENQKELSPAGLMEYINSEISKETNYKQRPEIKRGNIDVEFPIFRKK